MSFLLRYIKNITSKPTLAIVLWGIFFLEICFLTHVQALGGNLYNGGGSSMFTLDTTSTPPPHDRRKTAPEIRKYISPHKIHIMHTDDPLDSIGIVNTYNTIDIYGIIGFYNTISVDDHRVEVRKFKYYQHGPPEQNSPRYSVRYI